jgi:hypothetical protein
MSSAQRCSVTELPPTFACVSSFLTSFLIAKRLNDHPSNAAQEVRRGPRRLQRVR